MAQEDNDPLETVNRGVFWFNDKVDVYILEPAAKGYDYVVPGPVQNGVDNFFNNLKYPVFLLSDLLQFKFDQAATHTGRFLINTVFGLVGIFDVAEPLGLVHHYEDFGTALGHHGVPSGPYLVLPFLGPSNARDLVGRVADSFLDPVFYLETYGMDQDTAWWTGAGLKAVDVLNTRAGLLDAVESGKSASLDYYLFVRSAYYQIRQNRIYDDLPPDLDDEFEDFDEDEDMVEDEDGEMLNDEETIEEPEETAAESET
jgi:phospholipid-binding lipoprotein MlaA